jgi:hypothetical protein
MSADIDEGMPKITTSQEYIGLARYKRYLVMSESVIERPVSAPPARARKEVGVLGKGFATSVGYSLLVAAIVIGWYAREAALVNPEAGLGYWLGISGASMMLLLLLYPFRKRLSFLRGFGAIREWFRLHMLFGLIGPILILYHCNFQVGSFNSKIALYCMLLVAGSGIIGRHFYARIHRGLYGRKANLTELQVELESSVDVGPVLATLMPDLVARLQTLSKGVLGGDFICQASVGRSLKWSLQRYFLQWSLIQAALRELSVAAEKSEVVARDYKKFRSVAVRHISIYMDSLSRVSQFTFYERLFSLWHVLHLPVFFVMVITVILHVLAVHMY